MSIPGLPKGRRSRVFRRICQQLMTDPVLRNVVKTWDVWSGDADHSGLVAALDPMVRLTPQLGAVSWYSPDAQAGPLEIVVEAGVNSFDAGDCLDLWDAFEAAIYPPDRAKRLAFENELQDCTIYGAETGQIWFARPASIQGAQDGQFRLLGMMSINLVRCLDP